MANIEDLHSVVAGPMKDYSVESRSGEPALNRSWH